MYIHFTKTAYDIDFNNYKLNSEQLGGFAFWQIVWDVDESILYNIYLNHDCQSIFVLPFLILFISVFRSHR